MTDEEWIAESPFVGWGVTAVDPRGVVDRSAPGPVVPEESAAEVAGANGAVLDYVVSDDEAYGVPYYLWKIRVPQDRHRDQRSDGTPRAVAAVMEHLHDVLPDPSIEWSVAMDTQDTFEELASASVRKEYDALITPLEIALMPLRVNGAEDLDPRTNLYFPTPETGFGDYVIWLCTEPADGTWCLLRAGVAQDGTPPADWKSGDPSVVRGSLRLPLKPPAGPVVYGAEITTGPYHGLSCRCEPNSPLTFSTAPKPVQGVARRHTWLSHDPAALAEAVAASVDSWWPVGATPPANG